MAWDLLQKEILEKMKYFLRPTVSIQVGKHFDIPVEHEVYSEAALSTVKQLLLGFSKLRIYLQFLNGVATAEVPLELPCVLLWCRSSSYAQREGSIGLL